jgi:hypothetical protein
LAFVALIASILLVGCGANDALAPRAAATRDQPAATLIMVIRLEKPDASTIGVDANGKADDSSLTQTGCNRAQRLVDLFDPTQGSPRVGLARPTRSSPPARTATERVSELGKPLCCSLTSSAPK